MVEATEEEIINSLADKAMEHRLVLFLGSGFSKAVLGSKIALSWLELLKRVAEHYQLDEVIPDDANLPLDCPELASRLCRSLFAKRSRENTDITYDQCVNAIKRYACRIADWRLIHRAEDKDHPSDSLKRDDREPDFASIVYDVFMTLRPVMIVTTNYDHVIESILEGDCVSLSAKDVLSGPPSSRIPIYHLHGICDDPSNIVLTREDYVEATRPFSYRQSRLATLLRENSVLYVGYGKNDFNILSALDVAQHAFDDVIRPDHSSGLIHVQVIYPMDGDYPHQLYGMAKGCGSGGFVLRHSPVAMHEYYTGEAVGFLQRIADKIKNKEKNNAEVCAKEKATIEEWSKDIPCENDVVRREERRRDYEELFKRARSKYASRSVLSQELIKDFCNNIKVHYAALKAYSLKQGQFIGYAYCWAFLSAYFQSLGDRTPYSLFSLYATQFCSAVYLLNGLSKKMNEMGRRTPSGDTNRKPISIQWLSYDWKHKLNWVADKITRISTAHFASL